MASESEEVGGEDSETTGERDGEWDHEWDHERDREWDRERDGETLSDQNNNEGSSAQPRSYRATVEEVEDDEDLRSTSSRDSQRKTTKHYHPTLNGAFYFLIVYTSY